jgi:protein CpxP
MSVFSHALTSRMPFNRPVAIAALMGATIIAAPLSLARANTIANAAFQLAQAATPRTVGGPAASATKGETVEERIATLRTALEITSGEDVKWNAVAQSMRQNASNMDKLVVESRLTVPPGMTAVDDLKMYQKFSQAHVDGLKNLIASFSTLYSAMPDEQRKVADTVFQGSGETLAANR